MHRFRIPSFLLLLCALAISPGRAEDRTAPDWPHFRGPAGDGISPETDWDPAALLPKPRTLWQAEVGKGYSSVCIAGPRLFTLGYQDGQDTVYCLAVGTGKEFWRFSYPCEAGDYPGPRSTPLCADSLVYTLSRTGLLHCLEAATGKVRWKADLAAQANARPPQWAIATSPCLDGGLLLLNVGRYGLALDKDTGRIVWQSPRDLCGYASPVLYDAGGRRCMAAFGQKAAYGVEVKTGRLLWTFPWISRLDQHSADPVVWKDRVFISSIYGKGCTVFSIAGDAPRPVWLNENMTNKFGTCVRVGGDLYGIHGNTGPAGEGVVRCIDFQTGAVRWEHDLKRMSTLSAAGDKLLILTETGYLHIAEVRPDAYREIAQARVLESDTDREKATPGKCWTAPVLCRGLLFCRNDRGTLACINLRPAR